MKRYKDEDFEASKGRCKRGSQVSYCDMGTKIESNDTDERRVMYENANVLARNYGSASSSK